jgi:YD repeat-containing protein
VTSPDSGTANATFDAAGNLKTRIDARGKTSTYSYDAQNRLTRITYTTGTPIVFPRYARNDKGR